MGRCSCASGCACSVVGTGLINVGGTGSLGNPYSVGLTSAQIVNAIADDIAEDPAMTEVYSKKAAAAAQPFMALVEAELVDPCILIVGDSTSITGRWPYTGDPANLGFSERLADMFPTHTVKYYAFDTTAPLGGPYAYLPATTVSVGSGPRTINVYNASWGGHNCNGWKGKKGDAAFNIPAAPTAGMLPAPTATSTGGPDLTFVSLGHNEGVNDYWWHGQYLGLTEDLTQRHQGQLVVVSQNPTMADNTTGPSDGLQEARREVYRKIAARRGYGFIDATQAWLDSGHSNDWTSDGTHPIPIGSAFWASVIMKMFVWDPEEMPRTQPPSLFSASGGPNLLRNGDFQDGDDYWTLTGVASAVDAVNFETSSNAPSSPTAFTSTARKFTADGSGNNFISQRIPVERVRGKWFTFAVRQRVDSTAGDFPGAGVIQIQDSVSTLGTTQNVGATNGKDGFRWDVFTKFIDPAATYVIVKIFTNSGVNPGANITVDRAWAGIGRWPSDARRRETGKVYLNQSYNPTFSANFVLGNGTVVSRYRQDDSTGLTDVFVRITFGSSTTINNTATTTISLPVNILGAPTAVVSAQALFTRGSRYLGMAWVNTVSTMGIASQGANGVQVNLSATVPGTWTTGDVIEFRARYFHA